MRLILTGLVLLSGSGAALAAPCNTDPATVNGRDASVFTDQLGTPGGGSPQNVTCTVSAAVAIPAGHYGVYKVDSRGFAAVEDGESASYVVTAFGSSASETRPGPFADDLAYEQYFGTGLGPVSGFSGQFSLTVDGGPDALATIDSVDILAGYTTLASQQDSLAQVSSARTGLVSAIGSAAGLILGSNQRTERQTEIGVIGAVGSHVYGGYGHLDLGNGLSLDAGVGAFDLSADGGDADGVLLGAGLRFIEPDAGPWRWVGAVGASLAPDMTMSFTRSYADGSTEGATATAAATAGLSSLWAEGGVLLAPRPGDELVFSASLQRSWLDIDAYAETLGADNLFALSSPASSSTYDIVRAKAAWTTALAPDLELTLNGAVGHVSANDPVTADIAFVDSVSVGGTSESFVDYGARIGWSFAPAARWDAFALGSSGTESGGHLQLGTAVSMKF